MPRATKKDAFYIYAPKASGDWKNKRLIGVNTSYEGDISCLCLKDLQSFLEQHAIDPSDVVIGGGFTAYAKVKQPLKEDCFERFSFFKKCEHRVLTSNDTI